MFKNLALSETIWISTILKFFPERFIVEIRLIGAIRNDSCAYAC